MFQYKKTRIKEKNTYLWPKRRVLRRLSPFSLDFVCRNLYYNKAIVQYQKTRIKQKNAHQWPKRREMRRLGPFSSSLPPASHISSIKHIYIILVPKNTKTIKKYLPMAHLWPVSCRLGLLLSSPPPTSRTSMFIAHNTINEQISTKKTE